MIADLYFVPLVEIISYGDPLLWNYVQGFVSPESVANVCKCSLMANNTVKPRGSCVSGTAALKR